MSMSVYDDHFELVELFGKKALFTTSRIDRDSLPDGIYAYDFRHGDSGDPLTVEPRVGVNHAGTVIMTEPLDFSKAPQEDQYLNIGGKLNFLGEYFTFKDFMAELAANRIAWQGASNELDSEIDNTDKYIEILNERVLPFIDYKQLAESYKSESKAYAKEVMCNLHNAMIEAYGTDSFECHGDEEYIVTPAVIQSQKTGALALALLDIDLSSSGELCGIDLLIEYGIMKTSDKALPEANRKEIHDRYFPLSYGYTANVDGDIHDRMAAPTKDIKDFLKSFTQYSNTLSDISCKYDSDLGAEDDEELEP